MKAFQALLILAPLVAAETSLRGEAPEQKSRRRLQFPDDWTEDEKFCLGSVLGSRFDITDTPNYELWFDDNSIMHQAQAGQYAGLDAIQEYVNFFYTPFIFEGGSTVQDSLAPNRLTLVRDGNKCEVTASIKTCRNFVTPGFDGIADARYGVSADVLIGYRLFFEVTTPFQAILISRVNLYYPDGYLEDVFGKTLNTQEAREKICEVMEGSCKTTWFMNFSANDREIATCVKELENLDAAESYGDYNGYIDGNTLGCRTLHNAFAAENPFHCAHISIKMKADKKGKKKCQDKSTKDRVLPEDLFGAANLGFFQEVASKVYELPANQYKFYDTETCRARFPDDYD